MKFDSTRAIRFVNWFLGVYCQSNPYDWSRDLRKPMIEIRTKLCNEQITDIRSYLINLEQIGFLSRALEDFSPERINQMRGYEE